MADMDTLYRALRNADAAGDVESARKISNYIKGLQPAAPPPRPPSKERTMGEAVSDIGAGLTSGFGSLVQLPGQLYGLATGDFSKTGFLGAGQEISELGQEMKSAGLKVREQARAQKVKEAEEKGQVEAFGAALGETVKDPGLLLNFLTEQAPQLIVPFGGAKIAKGLTMARAGAAGVPLAEAAQAAGTAGTRAAIGTGAVQQGADIGAQAYEDIYKKLKSDGLSDEDAAAGAINLARATGASGAVISLLAQRLPGARTLEEALAGVPGKAGRVVGAGKGALGESASEMAEEVGGKLAQNIAMRQVDPTASLTAGLGETAAMAAIGGAGLGGISGALRRPGMPEQPPAPPPAAPVPPDIFMPPESPVDMAPPPAPVPPSATPVAPTAAPAAPPAAPAAPPVDWDANYFQGLPEGSSTVFQNRDRSSPASIAQMQKIAAQPDYSRVSVSREFSYGAPVVISDVALPEEKFGNVATATASDGTKIPVRYAVVDARDLLASNLADGTKNPVYENFDVNAIRAIAGNGRIAGIQAAYDRGTADNYKNELLADTSHGVNPDEIAKYERPVLIRVMPKSYVTPNIADISNISGTLGMSAIEQAKNDVSRVNIGGFDFTEDGNIRPESLNQFISAMPKEEQAALIGPDKKPTRQAVDRAHNALFYKAYGSDTLINLYAQATDVEARNVLNALARVAPKMAQLEGAGEYDIRNTIVQAAEGAINAKRRGLKISDYAQNADMGMDENTLRVLDMFGENSRSGSKMAEELNRLADLALQQSQAGVDMFGEQPKLPIGEVFNQFRPAVTRAPTPPKAEPKEFQIDKSNADIAKEIKGITTVELAKWTVDNAPNSVAKYIAEKVYARVQELDAAGALGDNVKVLSGNRKYNFRGRATYNLARDIADLQQKITIVGPRKGNENDERSGARYSTILHELIHVATIGQLRIQAPSKIQNDLKVVLQAVRKKIREDKKNGVQHPFLDRLKRGINAVQNEAELVTWACVDNDAQNYFATVKMGNTNAFSRLADIMRRLLGIDKQYQTALDRILTSTDELFAQPIEEIKKDIEQFGVGVKTLGVSPEVEAAESDQELVQDVRSKAKDILQKRPPLGEQSMAGLPQDFVDSLNKVFAPRNETVIDRIEGMKDRFWQRLAQGVADKYRTIKDYSEDAYMKARMSTTVDGALEGLLFHGHVVDDGGALNIRQNTKGLIKIMEPVGKEVDRYHIWVALNRDARMPADKKSIDPDLVARRDELIEGTLNGKPRKEVYEGVLKEMNAINKSVLDIALAKGLIDQKGYDRFSSDIFYIPFYKAMEDGDLERPSTASSLGGQYFSKQLKGGERPFADLMENTLRNWNHILSASMKNAAGKATVDAAMKHGAAIPNLKPAFEMGDDGLVYSRSSGDVVGDGSVQPYMTESGRGTIKIMQDGRPTYYEIRDPLLFESIAAISYMGPKSKFLSVAQDFKNILQFGVTASPIFKTNNLIRDSVSAMGVSDLKKNPIANVLQGMSLYDKDSPNYIAALSGGAIFNFGTAYEGNQSKLIRRLIDQGTKEETILDTTDKIKNALKVTWDKYQDLGNKSEAANRLALYQQLRDRGMSHLQASFMARDLLDFSMQGAWPAFRMLTQTVPFLNARVQGLYKLGRDGIIPTARVLYNTATGKEITESDRRKAQNFGVVTMGVMLASAMLYLAFKDDEDYQSRDEWDRDNFWWFKLPGMDVAFRIPKPFEIGAFGTLVERTLEQTLDSGAEGKQFTDSLSRTLWDTFSMNPTPQFLKPLIDIYANKDSFTGSPIETAGLERLSKQERIVDTTSPLAIALGGLTSILPEKAQLSPVQVDYMIKGYFGWLGGMASTASMYAVMPFREGEYPDARWLDRASLGLAKELPSNQSRYITAFYDNDRAISQAYADMRHYAEIGDAAKVMDILEEKGDKIELATFYDKTAKNMANMRKQIRVIMADESMTGAEKKEEIDRIKQMIGLLAQQAEEVRKSLKD